MSSKPIIGVSGNHGIDNHGDYPGVERSYLFNDFLASIATTGGVPIMLPIFLEDSIIKGYIKTIDALVLTGGHDICPKHYNETPSPLLGRTSEKRDLFDFKLLKCAEEAGIPILGICRGMQVLNVAHGGTLYQDLSELKSANAGHDQRSNLSEAIHRVDIAPDSELHKAFNDIQISINSMHHQAIKKLSPQFKVTAIGTDGIIEAIEHKENPDIIGVQWHPEMMMHDPKMRTFFTHFLAKANNNE